MIWMYACAIPECGLRAFFKQPGRKVGAAPLLFAAVHYIYITTFACKGAENKCSTTAETFAAPEFLAVYVVETDDED